MNMQSSYFEPPFQVKNSTNFRLAFAKYSTTFFRHQGKAATHKFRQSTNNEQNAWRFNHQRY